MEKKQISREVGDILDLLKVLKDLSKGPPFDPVGTSASGLIQHIEAKIDALSSKLNTHLPLNKKNEELAIEYLNSRKPKKWAEFTAKSEKFRLRHFIRFLGGKPLAEVDYKDIQAFIDGLAEKNYRESTIEKYITRIRQFFKWLDREYEVDPIDTSDISASEYNGRVPEAHVREPLSRDEMRALIQAPDNVRDRLIIAMLYETGLRVSELTNLELGHVDPETGTIRVIRGKGGKNGWTKYNPQHIGRLVDLWLRRERGSYPDAENNKYFFVSKSEKKLRTDQIRRIVHEAAEKAGIQKVVGKTVRIEMSPDGKPKTIYYPIYRVDVHTIRHTFATHAEEDGVEPDDIRRMMRHEDLSMTMHYVHRPFRLFPSYDERFRGVSSERRLKRNEGGSNS